MARVGQLLSVAAITAGTWLLYGRTASLAALVGCTVLLVRRRPPRRPLTRPVATGKVYLLHAPHSRLWKIGWTGRSAAARFAEIQGATREPLRLVAWGYGGRDVERLLHQRYRHLHVANRLPHASEWFALGAHEEREVRAFLTGTHRAAA